MAKEFYSFENDPKGVMWLLGVIPDTTLAYCELHKVPLEVFTHSVLDERVICPVDGAQYHFLNKYTVSQRLAFNLAARENLKDYRLVRIDSASNRVIAKERFELLEEWWIEAKASDSPDGVQLMIQAGKYDQNGKKLQLFVDSPRQRLGFDSSGKDLHPAGLLAKVVVTFKDSEATIKAANKK